MQHFGPRPNPAFQQGWRLDYLQELFDESELCYDWFQVQGAQLSAGLRSLKWLYLSG